VSAQDRFARASRHVLTFSRFFLLRADLYPVIFSPWAVLAAALSPHKSKSH
jgi:hypothetical protein